MMTKKYNLLLVLVTICLLSACSYSPGEGHKLMGMDLGQGLWVGYSSNKNNPVKNEFNKYKELEEPKAFAFAYDYQGRWVAGYSHNNQDVEDSKRIALKRCATARRQNGLSGSCEIVAINNSILSHEDFFE